MLGFDEYFSLLMLFFFSRLMIFIDFLQHAVDLFLIFLYFRIKIHHRAALYGRCMYRYIYIYITHTLAIDQ